MDDSGFSDPRRYRERDIRDGARDFEHAMKRMEHDLKHSERERMRAVKDAFKNNMAHATGCSPASSGPRTVEEVLVEIDSYLSYLEDMPKEKLAPYEGKVDEVAAHFDKVRSSLKK
jgi:hypothetical protein